MKQSLSCPSTSKTSQVTKKLHSFEAKVSAKPKSCDLCSKESHPVRLCPRLIQMAIEARENYIKKKQLCIDCFKRDVLRKISNKNGKRVGFLLRKQFSPNRYQRRIRKVRGKVVFSRPSPLRILYRIFNTHCLSSVSEK